jgi:2,3-bisphosphoglycerate-independent phosphoglycerate mutase
MPPRSGERFNMKKILYIILDGLADSPIPALGGMTPLEAALTPNLDRLAQKGMTGLVRTGPDGVGVQSDVAVISLLGYDSRYCYTGRGPLEAVAAGIAFNDGNIACRVNFATAGSEPMSIKDRRSGKDLTEVEANSLAKEINSRVTLANAVFEFSHTVGQRNVLVIRAIRSRLCAEVTNTDPAYLRQKLYSIAQGPEHEKALESKPLPGHENDAGAIEAALLLNEFSAKAAEVLRDAAMNKKRQSEGKLPADMVLIRDAGDSVPSFAPIAGLFPGRSFGCFVEMPVERGIAMLTGMEIVEIPSGTGHLDVDYPVWAKVALGSLERFNTIYIHLKGPDEPGHFRDPERKKKVIEDIDTFFIPVLLSSVDLSECIVCVTCDHATDSLLGCHAGLPVPVLVTGGAITPDGSLSFSEKAAAHGSLGTLEGRDLLPLLVKHAQ